jgi:predicted PurR-regulated permease PerM
MDQELEARLEQIEKMVSDNNRMLIRMRKAQKNAAYISAIYWIIFIILAVAGYYFVQPYIAQVQSLYQSGSNTASSVSNLIKQYEPGQK